MDFTTKFNPLQQAAYLNYRKNGFIFLQAPRRSGKTKFLALLVKLKLEDSKSHVGIIALSKAHYEHVKSYLEQVGVSKKHMKRVTYLPKDCNDFKGITDIFADERSADELYELLPDFAFAMVRAAVWTNKHPTVNFTYADLILYGIMPEERLNELRAEMGDLWFMREFGYRPEG